MDNISIIIRNKNEAEYIGFALQSCIEFFENPEIIVINNNSTDDSMDVVQNFNNRTKIITKNIDEYRPGIVDDRFIEELARNNIGAQAFSEGGSDLALESLQGSGAESLSLDAMNRDAMMNVSEVAVPDRREKR